MTPSDSNRSPTTLLRRVAVCAAPAAIVTLAVLLPFLNKAYTSDDMYFLKEATHALVDPLHPSAFTMVEQGIRIRLSQILVNGPVMAYLLIPTVLLGGAEWSAHALQALLVIVAAVATTSLAVRLGLTQLQATIAALLVVVSPAVIGMAGTAMPDVPAMAFTVAGVDRLVAWRQGRDWRSAILASLLIALGILSRPQVLLILVCGAAWLIFLQRWRREDPRFPPQPIATSLTPLAIAFALVALVVFFTRDPFSGDTLATPVMRRSDFRNVAFNLASFAREWVLVFPLGILWPIVRGRSFLNPRRTYVAFGLASILTIIGRSVEADLAWTFVVLFIVGHGIDVLMDIVIDAWRRRDPMQILLASWLLMAAAAASYHQLPSKLLIPSAPAMAILIAQRISPEAGAFRLKLVGGVGVISVVLGLLIIRTDAMWAEIGREGGRVVAMINNGTNKVWFDGHSGFQWYAERAGAEPLAVTPPFPKPGDVIVAGLYARLVSDDYPNKSLLYRRIYAEPGGRVQIERAGFFTNTRSGPLPWAWGHGELGRIEVWRITPDTVVRTAR